MPIKLIPPRRKKDGTPFSPYYYMRGTHLGVFVDGSTRAVRAALAKRVIAAKEREIERGRLDPATLATATFLKAARDYMAAGGEERSATKLIAYFGDAPLRPLLSSDMTLQQYWQGKIDEAALKLFPDHAPATRNREVYTPASAILKGAGLDFQFRRPKGSRGRELTGWLWPEQVEALLSECFALDAEFGILCLGYYFTGLRLSEWLRHLTCDRLRLSESYAFIPRTKNGEPRPIYLPPPLVAALANHPRGLDRGSETVFRFHKSGHLYKLLKRAAAKAGIVLPERQAFHIFRHTYGTQMSRVAGLSTKGLVATGAWKSEQAAARYQHMVVSEEAQKAALLPTPKIKTS